MAVLLLLVALLSQPADTLANLARAGWASARAAVRQGGSPESLAPARRAIDEIERTTKGTVLQLQGDYARAVIAAAMAAAQNEHGELDLQLAHARRLSERLKTSSHPARWPLAIDDVEGELYLAVYRYADAGRAYSRAGKTAAACDAYRRGVKALTGASLDEAKAFLKNCP